MKFVIVQVSRSYRLLVCGVITYINYISACTNHVTITLWEGIFRVSLVLPVVSFCVCVCKSRNAECHFSLCCCITTWGCRHCIVGFWVNRTLMVVRDTSCHQKLLTKPWFGQQAEHRHDLCDTDLWCNLHFWVALKIACFVDSYWVSWQCLAVLHGLLSFFVSDSLYFDSFWLLYIWHSEPYW